MVKFLNSCTPENRQHQPPNLLIIFPDQLRPMYWTTEAERDSFHYVDQWGPEHEADMAEERVLFDNQNDPYQMSNLVLTHPAIVDELYEALYEWLKKTDDPWLNN